MKRTNMKHILLIATGGTIASQPMAEGLTPTLSGEELARYVPQLKDICTFKTTQLMNIDSTNMLPKHWLQIARCIRDAYDDFDAFIVLHGTDTMAYTAAALSYLIQNSPKPIVLTGSQQPMTGAFTDAKLNLYQAALFACDDNSYDVNVVFGGSVMCGTRACKQKTMSYNAFTSINYPLIAMIRANKIIRHSSCNQKSQEHRSALQLALSTPHAPMASECSNYKTAQEGAHSCVRFYERLNDRVMCLRLTPGLKPNIFDALAKEYDALILETFGIGGIPNSHQHNFASALKDWIEQGKTLVLTTQVAEEGLDLGVYEVGQAFAHNEGVLRGADMTTEALLAKTMWVLGQAHTQDEIKRLFYTPINHDRVQE